EGELAPRRQRRWRRRLSPARYGKGKRMSLDKAELCDSLLLWLQTFHVPSPCTTKEQLTSGVAIAQVLNHIDPSWFNETWLGRIKEDISDWRLKVSNLKKILQSMMEYYHDVLGHQISEYNLPEVNLIGEHSDAAELGRMLQLVLGCAVSCEKKQEYIQHIMTLEESVQHVVMTAIQELLTRDPCDSVHSSSYTDLDYQLKRFTLCDEVDSKDELSQRCHELDLQIATLLDEKNSLMAENKVLRERMTRSDSFEESTSVTNKKLLLLQSQLEQLQEENFRLEGMKDDFRIRCEEMEKEMYDLQRRNDELTSLAEESQSLKDEMDVLRKYSLSKIVLSDTALDQDLSVGNLAAEMVPAELQEKIMQLQSENKLLRVQQEETYNNRLTEFQSMLDDVNRSKHKLENENRLNQQQITELRSQVEQLQRALQEQGSKAEDSNLLKRKLDEHLEKLHEAHTELQKKREYIDDLEPTVDSHTARKIDELQEVLKKKDEDMKAMEERYKRYLEKARTVIQTLDPKQTPTTAPEVQALKNQLHEKEAKIQLLENDFEKNKSQREQEEKLIISAWYNMGMALHQKVTEERSRGHGQAQSFLAQQRQATNARRVHPNRLHQSVTR
ncbi:hypothetical protein chiPu_0007731, partial [Chiloscyllium punctatum]|nr:hypothetical protein [Chiloscyllium punctatum]